MPRSAAAARSSHRCSECGLTVAKWVGRCPECQAWGSITETGSAPAARVQPGVVSAPAQRIGDVDPEQAAARPTGVGELDRVLGGGLVPGGVVLLAGEPGVGKSTLLLSVAAQAAAEGSPTLYVSGEESAAQVRLRAGRLGALDPHLWLAAETDLSAVLAHVDAVRPGLLVVDSVQTLSSSSAEGSAGGPTQVRAVTAALVALAKERGLATVLVGHVTKDGGIAGPRLLEHLVDVVLHFEGDRHSSLRMVRGVKNRFGAADEVGCFLMVDRGIREVPDPSGLFLTARPLPVAGTCVTVAMEGRRPVPVEVQALVERSSAPLPRRSVSGLDGSRLSIVLAVLGKHGRVQLSSSDVYAATVGGGRLSEPGADLAVALAVRSAVTDDPLPTDVVVLGELALAGDVRPVPAVARRLAEAQRLGFRRALVPPGGADDAPRGLRAVEVADLGQALRAVDLLSSRAA